MLGRCTLPATADALCKTLKAHIIADVLKKSEMWASFFYHKHQKAPPHYGRALFEFYSVEVTR
ncbi:hypothetical protein MC7420_1539 [Coleofasciculus chthonoplastes PCC 7420]|uniref:Uncharacterized protein n=1 Tax=Coleofasciculus chthonoplastes PCC 7420 TaxID=118168 RepID=B4W4T2_9CYAN|nr:hypothetical protein MC7420_1539 [Coleofasciculus chthonoplastes PCC 7420]